MLSPNGHTLPEVLVGVTFISGFVVLGTDVLTQVRGMPIKGPTLPK